MWKTIYGLTVEEFLNQANAPTIEVALTVLRVSNVDNNSETEDYSNNVNKNGGFYIGRYEAGTTTVRTSGNSSATLDDLVSTSGKPVSKEGAYPYNYVTNVQAKALAESMYEENNEFEVGLPEGRTWDRTIGWIYETGAKTYSEIYEDSSTWGYYLGKSFTITGETERNSANKIYDLAGNVFEWTSEKNARNMYVRRGGSYTFMGEDAPVDSRWPYDEDLDVADFNRF